jgi:DNA (cytosine-5)-methyltransferase 1
MTAKDALKDLELLEEDKDINHTWSRANVSPEQGNRRLSPDKPAHTIRAECHGNIQFHYQLPRRISMREAARIQSFPDDFIFEGGLRQTERQVGNAVPPVLAWHIANALTETLSKDLCP